MNVVRVAPRVVRSKDERVSDVANGVVDSLVIRECAVTSVVSNTEDGTTGQALEPPVGRPERPLDGGDCPWVEACSLESLDEGVDLLGELIERGDQCQITKGPGNALEGVALVKLLWNRIVNLLEGDLGELVRLRKASLVSRLYRYEQTSLLIPNLVLYSLGTVLEDRHDGRERMSRERRVRRRCC